MKTLVRECGLEECSDPHLALGYCRKHYRRFKATGDPRGTLIGRDVADAPEGHRVCVRCSETRELGEFPRDARGLEGRARDCKRCRNAYVREWAKENHERTKDARREAEVRGRYGDAGLEVLRRIREGESCEVCGEHTPRMAIDHDHSSGEVRGLLCSKCNTALGLLKDDPDRILSLLAYLISSQESSCIPT